MAREPLAKGVLPAAGISIAVAVAVNVLLSGAEIHWVTPFLFLPLLWGLETLLTAPVLASVASSQTEAGAEVVFERRPVFGPLFLGLGGLLLAWGLSAALPGYVVPLVSPVLKAPVSWLLMLGSFVGAFGLGTVLFRLGQRFDRVSIDLSSRRITVQRWGKRSVELMFGEVERISADHMVLVVRHATGEERLPSHQPLDAMGERLDRMLMAHGGDRDARKHRAEALLALASAEPE